MKGNNRLKALAVVVVIAVLTYITLFGLTIPGFNYYIPGAKDIRLGTDIQGGIHATLYAVKDDGAPTAEELEAAKVKIGKRLDAKGIYDRTITTDKTHGRIVVEIPWKKGAEFDPQQTIEDIGSTALLTFQEVDEDKKDSNGNYLPTGRIIIQGSDVVDARPAINTQTGRAEVALEITEEASLRFEEATGRLVGEPIAIFMDDQFISSPVVDERISGTQISIRMGTYDRNAASQQAKELAATIKGGALPFKLEAKEINSISPMLGANTLRVTIIAGLISLVLIFLFMVGFYRLPGFLACIALIGHACATILSVSWFHLTLTLPGIAGIILSVAMSVDANIIIYERIKEELRGGKTLKTAIDLGFKRAFSAIFDSNMTTIIAAVILWYFGTGAVQGFAYTLTIGVILSFLSAITASRLLVKGVAEFDFAKKPRLYGGRKEAV